SAVGGEFEGTALDVLPASLVSWRAWRELHPDTLVLDQGGPRSDPYEGYYRDGSAGVLGQEQRDERLRRKEFVLGVQLAEGPKAYPFRHLNDRPVVNDEVGGRPLVVTFDARAGGAAAFDRRVDGRVLTFVTLSDDTGTNGPDKPHTGSLMVDDQTGSTWDRRTGKAIAGPLEGADLDSVPSFATFWFAWSDFFPDAPLYEPQ
ncbi:MAG: DUF3179 domain-containing (seleno)protein, partial [Dehalococcoidia bacterium]